VEAVLPCLGGSMPAMVVEGTMVVVWLVRVSSSPELEKGDAG